MPGLVPGIPLSGARPCVPKRDGRDKPGHDPILRSVSRVLVQQPGLDQHLTDTQDLRAFDLDQWWPYDRAWQLSEQHQRLFHAVVHVDEGIRVEDPCRRIDAIVETLGFGQVVLLYSAK